MGLGDRVRFADPRVSPVADRAIDHPFSLAPVLHPAASGLSLRSVPNFRNASVCIDAIILSSRYDAAWGIFLNTVDRAGFIDHPVYSFERTLSSILADRSAAHSCVRHRSLTAERIAEDVAENPRSPRRRRTSAVAADKVRGRRMLGAMLEYRSRWIVQPRQDPAREPIHVEPV